MLVSIFMLRRMSLTQNRDRKSISDLLDQNNFSDRFFCIYFLLLSVVFFCFSWKVSGILISSCGVSDILHG